MNSRLWVAGLLGVALILGACGGGDGGEEEEGGKAPGTTKTGGKTGGKSKGKNTGPAGTTTKRKPVTPIDYQRKMVLGQPRGFHGKFLYKIHRHPDGKHFLTCSHDGTVGIWSYADGSQVKRIDREFPVADVAVSRDGKKMATAEGGSVYLIDVDSGKVSGSYNYRVRKSDAALHLAWLGGEKVAIGGNRAGVYVGHSGAIHYLKGVRSVKACDIALSDDGKRFAVASPDWKVEIWDAAGLKKTAALKTNKNRAIDVDFDASGNKLVTITYGREVRLFSSNGEFVRSIGRHKKKGVSVALGPKAHYAASADESGKIVLWNIGGNSKKELSGHSVPVTALCFTPDGKILISGDKLGQMRYWSVPGGKPVHFGGGHIGKVTGLAWTPDGSGLYSVGRDGQLIQWELTTGKPLKSWQHPEELNDLALDGTQIYTCGASGGVYRAAPDKFKKLVKLDREANGLALVPGKGLIVGTEGGKLVGVRLNGGKFRNWTGHSNRVYAVIYDPTEKAVITGGGDRAVKRWRQEGFGKINGYPTSMTGMRDIDITKDGRFMIVGTTETALLFDAKTRKGIRNFQGFNKEIVHAVAIHPNGQIVAAGVGSKSTREGKLCLLKADQELAYKTLKDHLGPVTALAFSPDGKFLASGSADGSVMIWEVGG